MMKENKAQKFYERISKLEGKIHKMEKYWESKRQIIVKNKNRVNQLKQEFAAWRTLFKTPWGEIGIKENV